MYIIYKIVFFLCAAWGCIIHWWRDALAIALIISGGRHWISKRSLVYAIVPRNSWSIQCEWAWDSQSLIKEAWLLIEFWKSCPCLLFSNPNFLHERIWFCSKLILGCNDLLGYLLYKSMGNTSKPMRHLLCLYTHGEEKYQYKNSRGTGSNIF